MGSGDVGSAPPGGSPGEPRGSTPSARSTPPGGSPANRAHGAFGEDRVARWYEQAGYTVVARNWRTRDGELDLVLVRGPLVVFCEVKARASDRFGTPVESVTPAKQARLRRLAAAWLRAAEGQASRKPAADRPVRFDVAGVLAGKVEVIEDAF